MCVCVWRVWLRNDRDREERKKPERESKIEAGRDRHVKRGPEIELRKDRLAAPAALTEMSPLNGFPVLEARPPYLISILLGSCSSDDLCRTKSRALRK